MVLALFLGINGLSALIAMVCAYADCFRKRDGTAKRIQDEELTSLFPRIPPFRPVKLDLAALILEVIA